MEFVWSLMEINTYCDYISRTVSCSITEMLVFFCMLRASNYAFKEYFMESCASAANIQNAKCQIKVKPEMPASI